MDIAGTLTELIQDVLDDDSLTINNDSVFKDLPNWNSLNGIQLISSIEGEFKIKFAMGETQALEKVSDVIEKIHAKLNKK